jgi:hypothetical protein
MITATTIDGFNGIGEREELEHWSLRRSSSRSRSDYCSRVDFSIMTRRAATVPRRTRMHMATKRGDSLTSYPTFREAGCRTTGFHPAVHCIAIWLATEGHFRNITVPQQWRVAHAGWRTPLWTNVFEFSWNRYPSSGPTSLCKRRERWAVHKLMPILSWRTPLVPQRTRVPFELRPTDWRK